MCTDLSFFAVTHLRAFAICFGVTTLIDVAEQLLVLSLEVVALVLLLCVVLILLTDTGLVPPLELPTVRQLNPGTLPQLKCILWHTAAAQVHIMAVQRLTQISAQSNSNTAEYLACYG